MSTSTPGIADAKSIPSSLSPNPNDVPNRLLPPPRRLPPKKKVRPLASAPSPSPTLTEPSSFPESTDLSDHQSLSQIVSRLIPRLSPVRASCLTAAINALQTPTFTDLILHDSENAEVGYEAVIPGLVEHETPESIYALKEEREHRWAALSDDAKTMIELVIKSECTVTSPFHDSLGRFIKEYLYSHLREVCKWQWNRIWGTYAEVVKYTNGILCH
jgi:hypothetical protein